MKKKLLLIFILMLMIINCKTNSSTDEEITETSRLTEGTWKLSFYRGNGAVSYSATITFKDNNICILEDCEKVNDLYAYFEGTITGSYTISKKMNITFQITKENGKYYTKYKLTDGTILSDSITGHTGLVDMNTDSIIANDNIEGWTVKRY